MNFRQFFGLCEHKWKNVSAFEITRKINSADSHVHNVYVLQCEKCGDVKSKKI